MLVLTPDLKAHAVKNLGVEANADDATFRKAISEALVEGKITPQQLSELTAQKATEAEQKIADMVAGAVSKAFAPLEQMLKGMAAPPAAPVAPAATPAEAKAVAPAAPAATTPAADSIGIKLYSLAGMSAYGADSPELIRVKSAVERYSDARTAATWDKSSNVALQKSFGGESVTKHWNGLPYTPDMPTDRSKAIAGAWFKHMAIKQLKAAGRTTEIELTEHEKQLVLHAAHSCKFVGGAGRYGDIEGESLADFAKSAHVDPAMMVKTVLDDSTSGGLEAVPIEFDAAVILTPLLNGEIFPFVNVTVVGRRRIEATKVSNPTMQWGTSSGTAIPLFDTDGFISAFDNSIYPITGAIEMGLDFLNDSPLAIGQIVVQRYGEVFRKEMDNVIVAGNGTNQPTGLLNASGTTSVSSANGTGGPATMGDYEGLMFAVPKEYMQDAGMPPNSRAMFIGTQTSYRRSRAIKVNASSDERRLYGMTHMDYRLHDFRYAISGASDLTNSKILFACMNRYRLYRRQGLEVAIVAGTDWNLVRQNKQGIALRARFGGGLEQGAACAKMTDAQT